jgi:predicted MFS family arabinose efflux permease
VGEEIIRRGGFSTLFAIASVFTLAALALAAGLPGSGATRAAAGTGDGRVSRAHWIIAATTMLAGMGFGTVITFIPTYVRGERLGRVGFFFLAYTVTAILTRIVGAGLSDSVGRRRVILPTLAALALSIFGLAFVRHPAALVAVGALFGSAQGISYPTLHAFLVDITDSPALGRAQALFNGAFNLGVTCSAFLFGAVAEHFGYRPMFALAALTPLAAWTVLYVGGLDDPPSLSAPVPSHAPRRGAGV